MFFNTEHTHPPQEDPRASKQASTISPERSIMLVQYQLHLLGRIKNLNSKTPGRASSLSIYKKHPTIKNKNYRIIYQEEREVWVQHYLHPAGRTNNVSKNFHSESQ